MERNPGNVKYYYPASMVVIRTGFAVLFSTVYRSAGFNNKNGKKTKSEKN